MILQVKDLTCGYGNLKIVETVSFDIKGGESICLLGPNGVGKTTFFKTMLGFLKPISGQVLLDGKPTVSLSRKKFAQSIAYVPQAHSVPFPFSVIDVVVAGRNVHSGITSTPSKKDYDYALSCIDELGINYLKEKIYTELSGGEQQMVLIARAMAQQAKILIMDEPTSNLDFGNQIKIINHINNLKNKNIAIIMTTHSPDHVFLCASKVIVFQDGKQACVGEPNNIITENLLSEVYGVDVNVCRVNTNKNKQVSVCIPNIDLIKRRNLH